LENGNYKTHKGYDFLFKKIRAMFGGEVRFLITGSAPIAPEILAFFEVALGIHVAEVYG